MLLRAIKLLTRVELQNGKIKNTKVHDAGVVFCAVLVSF